MFSFGELQKLDAFSGLSIMLVALLVMIVWPSEQEKRGAKRQKQQILLCLIVVSVVATSFWKNAPDGADGYATEAIQREEVNEKLQQTEIPAVKEAMEEDQDTSFSRYTGTVTTNASMIDGTLSSTRIYWSLINSNLAMYRRELQEREYITFAYGGHDGRSILNAFSCAKYYVRAAANSSPMPYGHEKLGEYLLEDGSEEGYWYAVYKNAYALPLGYTYDASIGREAWQGLSAIQKQEAMLQAVYLSDETDLSAEKDLDFTAQSIPYTMAFSDNVTQLGDSFVATSAKETVTFEFEGLENCETYLVLSNIRFDGSSVYELYFGEDCVDPLNLYNEGEWEALSHTDRSTIIRDQIFWKEPQSATLTAKSSANVSKNIDLKNENEQFYNGRRDFIVNLGYSEEPITSITLTLPSRGMYSFDAMEVVCQPMDGFAEQIDALREDVLENVVIGTDVVTGSISLDKPKILCLSIPYSKGWTAYVDGEKAELYQANIAYMGLALDEGEHSVELRYETPLLKLGTVVSLVSFMVLAGVILFTEKRRRGER